MYYFLTASKDATIYRQHPEQNTGLDQILEVSKTYYGSQREISRALIQFDMTKLAELIASDDVVLQEAKLILYETESEEIPLDYSVYAHPISESWDMGTGTRFDEITLEPVNWRYRKAPAVMWGSGSDFIDYEDDSGSVLMDDFGNAIGEPTFNPIFTGGTWLFDYYGQQDFAYQTADIEMDVTDIVEQWVNGNIENYGLIVKHSFDADKDANDYGTLKFFSKETHTIYQPRIRVAWEDQVFNTGSLEEVGDEAIKIVLRNFKKKYRRDKRARVNMSARDLYPLKTFQSPFPYEVTKFLPETTYYQIRDVETDTVIIPFSDYSKVSCDESGNFIILDFTNWEVNRAYKIEFRVEHDGSVFHFDDDDIFEIVN